MEVYGDFESFRTKYMWQITVRQADCLDCPVCHSVIGYYSGPAFLGSKTTVWKHICFHQKSHSAVNAVFHSPKCSF